MERARDSILWRAVIFNSFVYIRLDMDINLYFMTNNEASDTGIAEILKTERGLHHVRCRISRIS